MNTAAEAKRGWPQPQSRAGTIVKVSGPLVVAEGMAGSKMYDVVKVGDQRLIGEIIQLRGDRAAIQVYEETGGIGPGEPVYPTFEPLSVELGPGLIGAIYDGIQRPLDRLQAQAGDFISRGLEVPGLDRDRLWEFVPQRKPGEMVRPGDVLGEVPETTLVRHRILVPEGTRGVLLDIKAGRFRVTDAIAVIRPVSEDGHSAAPNADRSSGSDRVVTMLQRWPVRKSRPYRTKLPPCEPLVTGQRVIDTFFPIAKGGTACVPGPFGSGKTVIQHQLAKWADADIVIFVGCGERGNEMTDVLMEFPELLDPKTGEPLMKRTVLVANTSNMPVAAREASIYTGITIAEYYRDMGYSVALQADSTSRWAEALREISGRLEEMPGEEGYPAYLATRIAEFYERAGRVRCLGTNPDGTEREGSLSVIGAVSPPGGDLNDPVVQATLRVVKVFWSLEDQLANRRHFPAISWLHSYSLYGSVLADSLGRLVTPEFVSNARAALAILEKEAELEEIVRLVGKDTLAPSDQLLLEAARRIREDFLHQNAFHDVDTYASLAKQAQMLAAILFFYHRAQQTLARGASLEAIMKISALEGLSRMKYLPEKAVAPQIERLRLELARELEELVTS